MQSYTFQLETHSVSMVFLNTLESTPLVRSPNVAQCRTTKVGTRLPQGLFRLSRLVANMSFDDV